MTKINIISPSGGGGGGSGTVTSVAVTTGTSGTNVNVSGSPITTSGTITVNIPEASGTNTGKLKSVDWTTFNNKQNAISLTTTGTSGAATFVGATLNIPQYQGTLTLTTTGTSGAATLVGATLNIPQYAATPAGSNSQVQFNSSSSFGADSNFNWDNTNKRLGLGIAAPLGILHLKTAAQATRLLLDGDAGQNKIITFRSAGLQRWGLYSNNVAESGSNAGSNFVIRRYNDTGTLLGTPISVTRSTGQTTISEGLTLSGSELRSFKASTSTLSSLTVDSSNGAAYTGTVFLCSGSSVTIDASVADGFNLSVIQSTSTQTTISVTGGLTIRNRQGHTKTAGQYATVTLLKRGSDLYLGGDTA